jgi:type IV pilus assembly protein PilE
MKSFSMHGQGATIRRAAGFTLVELMIVVLIVGILAAIATPTYIAYVARTNRGAAKGCMAEFSQFMERYYTTNLTYVGAAPALGCQTESQLNLKYTIDVTTTAATQRTYMVTATPQGAQVTRDANCGTLTLNQAGTRTASGSGGVAACW